MSLRRGFGGHEGLVGEAAVLGVFEPMPAWTVSVGPDVTFASADYMETYFGVTPLQSFFSGLPVYTPSGGIKSAGIIADTHYQMTDELAILGRASWHRLTGDAADSPVIARAGNKNQFSVGVGLAYSFGLYLY